MSRVLSCLRLVAAVIAATGAPLAAAQAPTEAQVKAAYVLNFAKFTEWPASAFSASGAPLNVCVFGSAETVAAFASIHGKQAHGRDVRVRAVAKLADVHACHVLYFDTTERVNAAAALKVIAGHPVLTVGDLDGFVDGGGVLGLVLVDGRIRFDANRDAARSHGLQLRAQLLSLARVVR